MTIKELKEEFRPDEAAQEAVWYHGCTFHQASRIFKGEVKGEICVSKPTDPHFFVGGGLLIKGHCTLMIKRDVGSFINREGRTVENVNAIKDFVVKHYEELIIDNNTHTESWVVPETVIGVLVDSESNVDFEDYLDLAENYFEVPMYIRRKDKIEQYED